MRSAASRRDDAGTPWSCDLGQVDVVREQSHLQPAGERESLRRPLDLRYLVVEHEHTVRCLAAQQLENLQSPTGAARAFVIRVGHALQLVEDEVRHEQVVAEESRAREREQLAVHDGRRVDEEAIGVTVGTRAHEWARRQAGHREQLFALARRDPEADVHREPYEEAADPDRDRGGPHGQREWNRDRQTEPAPMPPPTRPASTCGSGTRSTRRSTTPTAFEGPAEDTAAGEVADETAQHSADSGQLGTARGQVLTDHEPGCGQQDHGEKSGDLDEHGASRTQGIGGTALRLEPGCGVTAGGGTLGFAGVLAAFVALAALTGARRGRLGRHLLAAAPAPPWPPGAWRCLHRFVVVGDHRVVLAEHLVELRLRGLLVHLQRNVSSETRIWRALPSMRFSPRTDLCPSHES
jgi:hypothetical protein